MRAQKRILYGTSSLRVRVWISRTSGFMIVSTAMLTFVILISKNYLVVQFDCYASCHLESSILQRYLYVSSTPLFNQQVMYNNNIVFIVTNSFNVLISFRIRSFLSWIHLLMAFKRLQFEPIDLVRNVFKAGTTTL